MFPDLSNLVAGSAAEAVAARRPASRQARPSTGGRIISVGWGEEPYELFLFSPGDELLASRSGQSPVPRYGQLEKQQQFHRLGGLFLLSRRFKVGSQVS